MPTVLVAGAAVQDFIYRFDATPARGTKGRARDFTSIGGGSGANAAVAVIRLGGKAQVLAPLGDDLIGEMIVRGLNAEGVDTSKILRIPGRESPVCSAIVDGEGERTILTWHPPHVAPPEIDDPAPYVDGVDAVLTDDRYPSLAIPLLLEAKKRGIPGVLDGDRAEGDAPQMLRAASHVVFGTPGLRGTSGLNDPTRGLLALRATTGAFLAVTLGSGGVMWLEGDKVHRMHSFPIHAVDTLGAGDTFHGAFALALAEKMEPRDALRFACAVAAIKCSRFGGRAGVPRRDEVDAFLAAHPAVTD
ncbi:PfkB family carbohydrate kinase [Pseudoxanthobacter sp.]|uniref:PfkB family carbohydrate kinase n=1 Tax=Pseudoxanthobacter sp. TaxID=1925742 RepID=UPI002FE050E2